MNKKINLTYRVNKYLTLKLIEGKTQIFVGKKIINHCKLLVMNIPKPNVEKMEGVNSMDEIIEFAEEYGLTQEQMEEDLIFFDNQDNQIEISLEEEFWAHCSSLQAWEESGYDTRLLDMRLAFPILNKLTKLGDRKAIQKFKDEIYNRFTSGYMPVILYLVEEDYLEFLTEEEIKTMFQQTGMIEVSNYYEMNNEEISIPKELLRAFSDKQLELFISATDPSGVKELNLWGGNLKKLPKEILKYKDLEKLILTDNKIEFLPNRIDDLINLKELNLLNNNLRQLPHSIGNIKTLQKLDLRNNNLHSLPKSIGKLENLRKLLLNGFGEESNYETKRGNFLTSLPDSFKNLKNLENLGLSQNLFSEIPPQIYELKSLESLGFSKNKLKRVSYKLAYLTQLSELFLGHNKLKKLPYNLGKLERLKHLRLESNDIRHLPKSIKNLKRLKKLNLSHNQLEYAPKGIKNFSKLEELDLSYNPILTVPEEVFSLPNLRYLHLPTSRITPPDFFLSRYKKSIKSEKDIWYRHKSKYD